jgi:hypothetical protein
VVRYHKHNWHYSKRQSGYTDFRTGKRVDVYWCECGSVMTKKYGDRKSYQYYSGRVERD